MGHVVEELDLSKFSQAFEKASRIYEKEYVRLENITESTSFKIMSSSKTFLDILDALIGLFTGVGDTISIVASIPSLYFSIFKAKSIKLTMAILSIILVDWLAGLVPVIGDILDAFYTSNRKIFRICVGYVEGDPKVMKEINRAAAGLFFLIIFVVVLLYFVFELIKGIS